MAATDLPGNESIETLILSKCLGCHGSDRRGGLDLRAEVTAHRGGDSGPVIVPGDPQASLLYRHVASEKMPPEEPLTPDEVQRFFDWIRSGGSYSTGSIDPFAATTEKRAGYDWWSLQPLKRPQPPTLADSGPTAVGRAEWTTHPIDRFISVRLVQAGLSPSSPATPRSLIRRATFDLLGLPPTPEEVDRFVQASERETGRQGTVGERAYAALLDELLASPHYGERWGRHWLDVVRFGESSGLEQNFIIDTLWPFRDYVIHSFNEDKPFDRLVMEHLAGDYLAPGDPNVEIGLAFLVCGPFDSVGNQDPAQAAQIAANTIDERIRATSESFLGLTAGCARCHDHKFDPLSQRDYYQMYASLAGIQHGDRPIERPEVTVRRQASLNPLNEEKNRILGVKKEMEQALLKRAESRLDSHASHWTRPPVDRTGTVETFSPVSARFVRLVSEGHDLDPQATSGHRIDEIEVYTAGEDAKNVAAASAGGKARGKTRTAEDFARAYGAHVTIDGAFGVTWMAREPSLTIELADVFSIDRVVFSSDREAALGDHGQATFVADYHIDVSLDGIVWTKVAHSHDRHPVNDRHRRHRLMELERSDEEAKTLASLQAELNRVRQEIAALPAPRRYWIGNPVALKDRFHIFLGGDPQRQGAEVAPAGVRAASSQTNAYALDPNAPEQQRRLRLAEWIVHRDNPLPARVLANRLWHYHFGRGIVATPSDFGFMGGRPSHPACLDWLASELIEPTWDCPPSDRADQAWRLKRIHRLIMTSQTYRQSSTYRHPAAQVDGDDRLLWRFPPRRLGAEAVRDAMLAVSGKLDTVRGGPGFRLYRYTRDNVATYFPLDEHGEDTYRRAVYHQNARAARMDLLTEFDAPQCSLATPRRVTTTSPLQALTLLNHDFTLDMAEALAQRLQVEAATPRERIARAFALCFARGPRPREAEASLALVSAHGLRAFCRGLFNLNEFIYLP